MEKNELAQAALEALVLIRTNPDWFQFLRRIDTIWFNLRFISKSYKPNSGMATPEHCLKEVAYCCIKILQLLNLFSKSED